MLVLVCYSCQGKHEKYACELCQKYEVGKNKIHVLQNNSSILDVSPNSLASVQVESETMNNITNPSCELFRRYVLDHTGKLRILCLHGFRQNASNFKGRTSALAKKLRDIVELTFIDAPHRLPSTYQPTDSCFEQGSPSLMAECKRRFAWLISPTSVSLDEQRWEIKQQFDPLQFQMQTEGYEESYLCLQNAIQRMGPFDGILGFSQGAAMAALFFEHQRRNGCLSDFRFAVLCSGFAPSTMKSDKLCIECPSLHVFGRGKDRQINTEASRELAELFDSNISVTIEHDMGHIIPTGPPYIGQIRSFLMAFL
ncbi:hypothetical protein HPP92_003397 [Vanilla planifolia]|uniref:Serine hydrolase domain-containing protein n=1 Tax=Vanilla planifolia TaxID=51239 RepID=A0A835SAA6_VANPL|nr:hypothetical protein HPP92_003397 [Vanilla planifolia]